MAVTMVHQQSNNYHLSNAEDLGVIQREGRKKKVRELEEYSSMPVPFSFMSNLARGVE